MEFTHDEIGIKGKNILVRSIKTDSLTLVITGRFVKTIRLKEEYYQDISDPNDIINKLYTIKNRPDILTFIQRYPSVKPQFGFKMEYEKIAVLDIKSYEDWLEHKANQNTRRAIEKAKKKGVIIRLSELNDEFAEGMRSIFNETPIRQNKRFWHYGKDADVIKREFSRFLFREKIIGAFFDGELIGFLFLAYAGKYAIPTQIISKLSHREKNVTNALFAKAVELCANDQVPYILYGNWQDSSLDEFKRRNGFQKVEIPRYFVPLTGTGRLLLRFGLQRGLYHSLPTSIKKRALVFRSRWHSWTQPSKPSKFK